jgi:hypothetical protein
MGTLKVKNNAGEWVEMPIGMNNELKYTFVTPGVDGDQRKLDLSAYIAKGSDFIVFFGTSNKSSNQGGLSPVYAYLRSLDEVRQLNGGFVYDVSSIADVFKTQSAQAATYDEETRILTLTAANSYDGFESSVLLMYAG